MSRTKRTPKRTPKTTAPATPNTLDAMLETRQTEMLTQAVDDGSYIITGYWNWFDHHITTAERHAQRDDKTIPAHVWEHTDNDVKAWKRAQELFFIAAPVALEQLRRHVAEQIQKEFAFDAMTAADVGSTLHNSETANILKYALR